MLITKVKTTKKAVSPVIATILLIGIVIVIALIIFFWFRGLTEEAVTKFGGTNIKLVCDDVQFESDYNEGKLLISNIGNVPIYDFDLKISGEFGYVTKSLRNDVSVGWLETGLNQGEVFSGDISSISEISSSEEIIVIPVLVGESKEGKKTHACEERHGHKIIL
jgi:flagellin-like protein